MSGRGFAPDPARAPRPRGTKARRLVNDGSLNGRPLPLDVLPLVEGKRQKWHPQTLRWWENWRRSPQAARMMTAPDWDFLVDTALLHHEMWTTGQNRIATMAEIRLRVAKFGATPEDRQRLRLEIEEPTPYPTGNGTAAASAVDELNARRQRILGTSETVRVVNATKQMVRDR
jgi:hypothetical protein